MANNEDLNLVQPEVTSEYVDDLYEDPFTVQNFLERVYINRVQSDSAHRADVQESLQVIENIINEGTDLQQSNLARNIGFDTPELDESNRVAAWTNDTNYRNDLDNVDWDLVEGLGFGRINPNTGQIWGSVDELFTFFNIKMDISGTGLDPAYGQVGQDHMWDHYNVGDNTSSKYPRIVGSDHNNHLLGLDGQLQNNPYYYLSSAYVAGTTTGEYDKSSDNWFQAPSHTSLNANIAMNMFRFEKAELSPANFNKFFGSNRSYVQPDYFHPLANVGDNSTALNGFSPSPFVTGYMSSKYLELNNMVLEEGGHWVYKDIHEDGVFVGKEKVFIDVPKMWHASAVDEDEKNYRESVIRNVLLTRDSDGLTQGDFISKFGPSHELLGIFNSGNANTTGLSSKGTNISNHSFYAEQSDIPGFNLLYSAGNSQLALGLNFDPYSNFIQSVRFGDNFPTADGGLASEVYPAIRAGGGMHYHGIHNMVASYSAQYFDDFIGRTSWVGRAANAFFPLEESGFLPESYTRHTDINISTGPGFGSARGQLGTNAYLGFDAQVQGQIFLGEVVEDGYVDPFNHFVPYFYDRGASHEKEYSKFTIGRGQYPHARDMRFGGGSFLNHGLPNYSNTLSYKMKDGSDFEYSNNIAMEQGEVSFKKFILHVLENAGNEDYYIKKSFEDLSQMYQLIITKNGLNTELLNDLGAELKTMNLEALEDAATVFNNNRHLYPGPKF